VIAECKYQIEHEWVPRFGSWVSCLGSRVLGLRFGDFGLGAGESFSSPLFQILDIRSFAIFGLWVSGGTAFRRRFSISPCSPIPGLGSLAFGLGDRGIFRRRFAISARSTVLVTPVTNNDGTAECAYYINDGRLEGRTTNGGGATDEEER
jgi:hypothetical protein